MISMLSALSTIPSTLPMTIAKVTGVLAMAGIATLVLRGASAAVRHLVWLLALGACVALAIVAPAAPRIDVPVPGMATTRDILVPAARSTTARSHAYIPIVVAPRVVSVHSERVDVIVPDIIPEGDETPLAKSSALPFIAVGLWLVGFGVVIARARLAHARVASIIDDARRLTSAEWQVAIAEASFAVGLRREVEVFESDEISSPMTSGFLNPVVVVPMDAREWNAERRHIVLVHELAHVARYDYLAQLVATLACAMFWFHPLAWFASARLRAEAEHAADDRVLNAGTVGVTYASHLLEIARHQDGNWTPAAAVGMVRSSRLEGRFRAMLDASRSRTAVSNRFQALAVSLTLCAMIPVAGLRPIAPERTYTRIVQAAPAMSQAIAVDLTAPRTTAIVAARAASAGATAVSVLDSIFEKTVSATAGDRLTLDLRTGGAIIIHGWDEPRVRVIGRLRGDDWRDTRVFLERVDGGVRLQSSVAPKGENWSTAHEFELWVPRHTNVQLSSAGGSLAINDVSGDFYGHTAGGGITIRNATGSATLSTGGGEISVTDSRLSGTVSSGGGELTISNVTGGLRGSSGTGGRIVTTDGISTVRSGFGYGSATGIGGGVTTTVTSGGFGTSRGIGIGARSGALVLSKDGGEIVIDRAPDGAVLHTGGGRIVVGSSDRSISATTGGGDIELENVAGDATASTGAGDVRISLRGSGRTDRSIDVESGKGRVVIEVPATLDTRIEIESAYTDNYNRRTNITSDFALENSETDQWDSSHGTPRKYVRATGVIGNGRGLIRIHTVNGDVVLKKVNR
jgi:beta-lactamase regulating signal transducer with metallopeptidase domain/DUF4097 and DUF4098 domain-containing protein YvlB